MLQNIILMKRFIRFLLLLVLAFVIAFIVFYFWAKSPTLDKEQYLQIVEYSMAPKQTNDTILSVMSYNIGYLSGMTNNLAIRPSHKFYQENEKRARLLTHQVNADIIGFQEIDYDSKRSYHLNQHQYIAEDFYPYNILAVNWDKHYVPFPYHPLQAQFGKILSGQSVMSKFPLVENQRLVLESVKSNPFYYNAFYLSRLMMISKVKHPLKEFIFINVHTEAFDRETRNIQLKAIYDAFCNYAQSYAVVLVGDFNSDPRQEDENIRLFLEDGRIGTAALDVQNYRNIPDTYPSNAPDERLDYIFYTKKDFELLNSKIAVDFGSISDHLPCYAELKIKTSAPLSRKK